MEYFIDYSYYKVLISENVGLFQLLKKDLGLQFPLYVCESVPFEKSEWTIKHKEGVINSCNEKCKTKKRLEHNLEAYVHIDLNTKMFLSIEKDWAIEVSYNNIFFEAIKDKGYDILVKILKQISRYENHSRGLVLFHSSCIEINGKAYLFLGEKGAGKTTVLLNVLNQINCNYIGNDITVVSEDLNVYPIYSKVGIGIETIRFVNKNYGLNITTKHENKKYFQLSDFLNLYKVNSSRGGLLSGIYILSCSDSDKYICERMEHKFAYKKLSKYIMSKGKDVEIADHPDWMLLMNDSIQEDNYNCNRICDMFSKTVPCYTVEYNMRNINDFIDIKNSILAEE